MIHLLIIFLYLARVVRGTTTDTTSTTCPPPDGTSRSLWSILGSCALTLLICVWHAIHFDVPGLKEKWRATWVTKAIFVIGTLLLPEVMLARATNEWWKAVSNVRQFRGKGYEWSMTHSFFDGLRTIGSLEFLALCEANKITHPLVTVKDIMDRSKSETLGKAIFAVQLLWFTLQVIVRVRNGLAVTLVELDTACMAILTVLLLLIWKNKPLRPERPHMFYAPQEVESSPVTKSVLSQAWKSEPCCLYKLMTYFVCERNTGRITDEEKARPDEPRVALRDLGLKLRENCSRIVSLSLDVTRLRNLGPELREDFSIVSLLSLCAAWFIFGALHLAAWYFPFATKREKMAWRIASLTLAVYPLALIILISLTSALRRVRWCKEKTRKTLEGNFMFLGLLLAELSRITLLALMFYSLRSIPCSAYHTVSWTAYIPHL